MNLVDELLAITETLREAGIRYAVCGGIAVTIHGATRTTKDIDLLVDEQNILTIIERLRPLGYVFAALPMTFEADTPRERRVQRISKMEDSEHLCVDLIAASAAFSGLLDDALDVKVDDRQLTVISLAGLLRMKQLAGRPQDIADLAKLAGEHD